MIPRIGDPSPLLHRILANRLKNAISLDASQRGFVNTDGSLANVLILDYYLQYQRERGSSFNIVALDVKKAFDLVSHGAIRRARIQTEYANYIMGALAGASTTISVGDAKTCPISLKRGVRQGDPLSPVLFNMVVDELLAGLKLLPEYGGTLAEGFRTPAMAFADDLILLEDEMTKVPVLLSRCVDFFKRGDGAQPSQMLVPLR